MIKKVSIKDIRENEFNPRFISESKFKKLVKSIKDFPQMLEKRPIVVDEDMVVLGGNMRLKACLEAGLTEVYISVADGWTEEQKQEFIIKDNVSFGQWDWDILANNWDNASVVEWGLDLPKWENDLDFEMNTDIDESYEYPDDLEKSHVKMVQLFLNTETEPVFRKMELELRSLLNTDNVTDTVYKAVEKLIYLRDTNRIDK